MCSWRTHETVGNRTGPVTDSDKVKRCNAKCSTEVTIIRSTRTTCYQCLDNMEHRQLATCLTNTGKATELVSSTLYCQHLIGKGKRHSRGQPVCTIFHVKVGLQELNAKCTKGTSKEGEDEYISQTNSKPLPKETSNMS